MAILESEYRNKHKIYILIAKSTKAGFKTLNLRYYEFGSDDYNKANISVKVYKGSWFPSAYKGCPYIIL